MSMEHPTELDELSRITSSGQIPDPDILARAWDKLSLAIVIVDSDFKIYFINEHAEMMFDYNRNELIGKHIEIVVPDSLRNVHVDHRNKFKIAPRARPMGADIPLKARRKDGTEFAVAIELSPFRTLHSGTFVTAQIKVG